MTNIFKVIHGDSFRFKYEIPVDLTLGDIIYVGVMYPHQPFEDSIITRKFILSVADFERGYINVRWTSGELYNLDPGVYYYAIKCLKTEGKVETLRDKTKLVILDDTQI